MAEPPVDLLEVVAIEKDGDRMHPAAARAPELPCERLLDPLAVQRPGQWIDAGQLPQPLTHRLDVGAGLSHLRPGAR